MTPIVPEIILVMPSCSAVSSSPSPRFSRRKSIFCFEYTRRPFTLAEDRVQPVAGEIAHPLGHRTAGPDLHDTHHEGSLRYEDRGQLGVRRRLPPRMQYRRSD